MMELHRCARCGRPQVPDGASCPSCGFGQSPSTPSTPEAGSPPEGQPPTTGTRPARGRTTHRVRLVVVVVVTLLLLGTVWVLAVSLPRPVGTGPLPNAPIGTAFAVEEAIESSCANGNTFVADGCAAGHFEYTLYVESSDVTFGDVRFEVQSANGSVAREADGLGFTILNASGTVLAQFAVTGGSMAMGSGAAWSYSTGITSSTPIRNFDTIMVDTGTSNPLGQGLLFVVFGVGRYTGYDYTGLS